MRLHSSFILVVLVALAGCNGIVGGLPAELSGGMATADGNERVVLRLSESSARPACNTEEPGDLELVLDLHHSGGVDAGAYDADPTSKNERRATATFKATSKVCGIAIGTADHAKKGTVTVARVDFVNQTISGTYHVDFGDGSLDGPFNAGVCQVPDGKDVDKPDCDDVDHDGEPGGERQGGGGGGGD